MNTWFRFYHDVTNDPKVQELPPRLFKAWVNVLCLTCRHGNAVPSIKDIAFGLRVSKRAATAIIDELITAGLIEETPEGFQPHNWLDRQFKSDSSTERVKRFREQQRNVSETVTGTGPDTETDTETEADQKQNRTEQKTPVVPKPKAAPPALNREPKYSAEFLGFWAQSTQRGSKFKAWQIWQRMGVTTELIGALSDAMRVWKQCDQWQDEKMQPHISTWFNRRGWEEIPPRRAAALPLQSTRPTDEEIEREHALTFGGRK